MAGATSGGAGRAGSNERYKPSDRISRAAAQVIYFFRNAILTTKDAKRGSAIFSIDIPRQQFESVSRRGQRLTGDVSHPSKGIVEVTYRADDPWKVAKQVLMDTALPMPNYRPRGNRRRICLTRIH